MLVQGQIIAITPPDYTNNFGVQYQNITVQTVQGPVEGRIGTKKPYTAQNINQQGQWDCEAASNNQGTYNKFKKHYDKPYQGQQGTQQAPQTTNPQQPAPQGKNEPDWDAKDLRMARMNSLTNSTKLICLIAEANKDIDVKGKDREGLVNLVTQTADILLHYIYNGLTKKQAPDSNQSIQNEPTKAQFCDGCRNLKEECTCNPSY